MINIHKQNNKSCLELKWLVELNFLMFQLKIDFLVVTWLTGISFTYLYWRFYNRETKSTAFCVMQQMSIKTPFPNKTQIITPFLNSIISSNHEKWDKFLAD